MVDKNKSLRINYTEDGARCSNVSTSCGSHQLMSIQF